jgi:NAD(P)-dependent dehydrogenase (short-subunit alcohol dehydrogenase family)
MEALSPERLFSLAGKVAFITGSAGGIGFGLARGFAAAGARVVLSDRNPKVHESLRRGRPSTLRSSSTSRNPTQSKRRSRRSSRAAASSTSP